MILPNWQICLQGHHTFNYSLFKTVQLKKKINLRFMKSSITGRHFILFGWIKLLSFSISKNLLLSHQWRIWREILCPTANNRTWIGWGANFLSRRWRSERCCSTGRACGWPCFRRRTPQRSRIWIINNISYHIQELDNDKIFYQRYRIVQISEIWNN